MAGLPPLPLTAPPANPIPGGLYTAATVLDAPDNRHHGGITLDSPNAGGSGQWPVTCPTPDDTPEKTGRRPAPRTFPATVVWAADECRTVGLTDDESRARAAQILRLREETEVEKHVAAQFLAPDNGAEKTSAADLTAAVAAAEGKLADAGYAGVVHADRRLIVAAEAAKLIRREGQALLTPGGHRWAFGAGYAALGGTVVATGPVIVRRGPVIDRVATSPGTNTRVGVAERVVAAAWEPPTVVITTTQS